MVTFLIIIKYIGNIFYYISKKIIEYIKLFIQFLKENPIFAYVLFGFFLGIIFIFIIKSCNTKEESIVTNPIIDSQIIQGKDNQKEAEEETIKIEKEKKEKEKEIQQVESNYNSVFNQDSNSKNYNYNSVREKWCKDHETDSKCL